MTKAVLLQAALKVVKGIFYAWLSHFLASHGLTLPAGVFGGLATGVDPVVGTTIVGTGAALGSHHLVRELLSSWWAKIKTGGA